MQPPEGFTFKLNRGLFQSEKIKINLVSPKKIAHEVKSGEINHVLLLSDKKTTTNRIFFPHDETHKRPS